MTTYSEIENAVEQAADYFQELYLDWLNNFVTVAGFARYYNITEPAAERKIQIGRKIHNQRTGKL